MREPLLIPSVAMAAGIAIGLYCPGGGFEWALLTSAAILAFSFRCSVWLRVLAGTTVALAFGVQLAAWRTPQPPPIIETDEFGYAIFEGCIVEPPQIASDRASVILELDKDARARVSVRLRPGEKPPELKYGQKVELPSKLRLPRNFLNEGAFDYQQYLADKDIYWLLAARSAEIKVIGECGSALQRQLGEVRLAAIAGIERNFSAPTAVLLRALLIGESVVLERELTDAFRRTGSYHALVISGMHVSLLAACLLVVLRYLPVETWIKLLPGAMLAVLYSALAGWQLPLVRAALALILLLPNRWLYRSARPLNLLALGWMLLLIYEPRWVWDRSLLLSIAAVSALAAFVEPIVEQRLMLLSRATANLEQKDRDLRLSPLQAMYRLELRLVVQTICLLTRFPKALVLRCAQLLVIATFWSFGLIVSTLLMQTALFPMQVGMFHQFPLTGILANLTVTPILSAMVPLGVLSLLAPLPPLISLLEGMRHWSEQIVTTLAEREPMPRIPDLDPVLLISGTILVVSLAMAIRSGRTRWAALLGVPACLLIVVSCQQRVEKPATMALTMLDVGQGESMLLSMPDGRRIMVDGGGIPAWGGRKARLDIGDDVVSPYLWHEGISQVDILISTHQHDDHLDGLHALLENFRPKEIWAGGIVATDSWKRLVKEADKRGVKIKSLRTGDRVQFGLGRIEVVWPPKDYQPKPEPTNNDSLMFVAEFGAHRFLLTGDAEGYPELSLADSNIGNVDVLKVGHHGSKTSTSEALLDVLNPKIALMSLGKENMFRFPHPAVVKRLNDRRVLSLRTDRNGQLDVVSDGKRLRVASFR